MSSDSNQELKTGGSGGGGIVGYDDVLTSIVSLLESARRASSRAVNAVMTATYWDIGRRVIEFEQGGADRAEYGERLLERLSEDLTGRFGRGFGMVNLSQMRKFYLLWPLVEIFQTPSEISKETPACCAKTQMPSVPANGAASRPFDWCSFGLVDSSEVTLASQSNAANDIDGQDAAPVVVQYHETVHQFERRYRDGEEAHRFDVGQVVPRESLPALDFVR